MIELPQRHGQAWLSAETDDLRWTWVANFSIEEIANYLERNVDAVIIRLVKEGFAPSQYQSDNTYTGLTRASHLTHALKQSYAAINKIFERHSIHDVNDWLEQYESIRVSGPGTVSNKLRKIYTEAYEGQKKAKAYYDAGAKERYTVETATAPEGAYYIEGADVSQEAWGNLKVVTSKELEKEMEITKIFNALEQDVRHITTYDGGFYKTHDRSIKVDDTIVVDFNGVQSLQKVKEVNELPALDNNVTAWVVQKVDLDGHKERLEREKAARETIKGIVYLKEHKKALKELRKTVGKDPEMQAMTVVASALLNPLNADKMKEFEELLKNGNTAD